MPVMPGEVVVDGPWDPIDDTFKTRENEKHPYKPEMAAPAPGVARDASNPFSQFIGEKELPAQQVTTAPVSLWDRFKGNFTAQQDYGSKGINELTEIQDAENGYVRGEFVGKEAAAPQAELIRQRRLERQAEYERMPGSETSMEYLAAIGGGLLGGVADPISLLGPEVKVGTVGWQAAHPVISKMLNYGVSGAATNAALNATVQAEEMGADLRPDWDFDWESIAIDAGAGAGFGAIVGGFHGKSEAHSADMANEYLKAETQKAADEATLKAAFETAPEPGKTPLAPRQKGKGTQAEESTWPPRPTTNDSITEEHGPREVAKAQETLFGEVIGTRNLSTDQLNQVDDFLNAQKAGDVPQGPNETKGSAGLPPVDLPRVQGWPINENGKGLDLEGKAAELSPEEAVKALTDSGLTVDQIRAMSPQELKTNVETIVNGSAAAPAMPVRGDAPPEGEPVRAVQQQEQQEVRKAAPLPLPRNYQDFSPSELKVDAKRFQFKEGGDEAGATDRLKGVKEWDQTKAGITLVWQDLAGNNYIADGHQRHALAARLEAEGQNPKIHALILKESEGYNPEKVRAIAAAANIAQGTGTAIDAAKILRAAPDMAKDLPPNSALVRDAKGLAELSDDAFGMVTNKIVPPGYAAIVGRLAPDKPSHAQILSILRENNPENTIEAESIVRDAISAPAVQEIQNDMFGSAVETQVLFKERAQVLSSAATAIRKDRAAFNTLVKEEGRLTRGGNKLATKSNAERAAEDAKVLAILQAEARRKGPIADALAGAAAELRIAPGARQAIVGNFLESLRGRAAIGRDDRSSNRPIGRPLQEDTPIAASLGGYRNTDQPAFRKWFGDSEATTPDGQPLVLYHGTDANFESFDKGKRGSGAGGESAKLGFFFSDSPRVADTYSHFAATDAAAAKVYGQAIKAEVAKDWNLYDQKIRELEAMERANETPDGRLRGQNTLPVYLKMQRPKVMDFQGKYYDDIKPEFTSIIRNAKAEGYDGVIAKNLDDAPGLASLPSNHYIVFEPTQIKSIYNRGTWDAEEPNISFSVKQPALFEPGAEGLPQSVVPGAERATQARMAQRGANAPLRAQAPQKALDIGLFGDSHNQLDLVDLARIAPMVRADADYLDLSPGGGVKSLKIGSANINYSVRDGEVEIHAVRVPVSERGQGAARSALITFLEKTDAADLRVKSFSTPLDKTTDREGVIRLYEGLGFTATGRKINKYGDIEMVRHEPPPEMANLRRLVGSGKLIPLRDYTDPATARQVKEAYYGVQPERDLDVLYAGPVQANQRLLSSELRKIADEVGVEFHDPGPKDKDKAAEKILRKGYTSLKQLTDLVRGGLRVDTPEQAQRAVHMLAEKFMVLDEGWSLSPNYYFDRKVSVTFPDGSIGEVQFWQPDLIDAKVAEGHALYEQWRQLPLDDPQNAVLEKAMVDLYRPIYEGLDPSWGATVGRGGISQPENVALSSSSPPSRSRPESATSAPDTGVQGPPGSKTAQARPANMTAGRDSQSTKRNMGQSDIAFAARPQPQSNMPVNRDQAGQSMANLLPESARRLEDIADELAQISGVPVRQGRLARSPAGKVAGQFDRTQGVMRLREMSDFETMTHETAHALENEWGRSLNTLKTQFASELEPMAYAGANPKQQLSEGFAEFMRYYVTTPNYAKRTAPAFYQAFENFLTVNHPEKLQQLKDVSKAYTQWTLTPSRAAVAADITSSRRGNLISDAVTEVRDSGAKVAMGTWAAKGYGAVIDKLHPIKRSVDELMKVYEKNYGRALNITSAQDPYRLARLLQDAYSAGHIDAMHGVVPYRSTVSEGASLSDAIGLALGENWKGWDDDLMADFAAYLVSRRAVFEYQRFRAGDIPNPPGKFTEGDYRVTIEELEKAHPHWTDAAEMVYDWGRNMLRKKYESGFITQKLYEELSARPDYVPFMRDLTDLDREVGAEPNQVLRSSIMKAFKGSKRSVINPLESMLADAYHFNALMKRNDIFKALDDLGEMAGRGSGAIVERIPSSQITGSEVNIEDVLRNAAKAAGLNPSDVDHLTTFVDDMLKGEQKATVFKVGEINEKGEPIIYVWRDGKKKALRLADGDFGREMYDALSGMNKEVRNFFVTAMSLPSTVLRYSITTSPPFMAANYLRDQVSAWVLTGDGYIPFISGLKGMRDEVTQSEITRIYNSFGGIVGGGNVASLDKGRVKRDISALNKKGYTVKRFANIRGFNELTGITETGTRLGVFSSSFKRAKRDGLSDYEAAVEAAYQARDLIDFGRHGSQTHTARRLVTFLNASVQGLDKAVRTLGAEGAIRKAIAPIINKQAGRPLTSRDKRALGTATKAWAKLLTTGLFGLALAYVQRDNPDYEEVSDYLRATHWVYVARDKDNKVKVYAIPKPFELGFVSNLFERTFDATYGRNPIAMQNFLDGLYEVTAPPTGIALFDVASELKHNVDNQGRPIVGEDIAGYEPWRQYNAYTSELAKKLGEVTGLSPAKIDHAIQGFGASWGRIITDASNAREQEKSSFEMLSDSVANRFVRDVTRGSTSSRAFWGLMSQTTGPMSQAAATYKDLYENGQISEASNLLSTKDENTKAFAMLTAHFPAEAQRMHPLIRTKDAISVISKLKREIADNDVKRIESAKDEEVEKLPMTASQRNQAQEQLARLSMMEARNALITLAVPGWAQKKYMDSEALREEIRLANPEMGAELDARYEEKHVLDDMAVRENWPELKSRVLEEGPEAYLDDLVSGME